MGHEVINDTNPKVLKNFIQKSYINYNFKWNICVYTWNTSVNHQLINIFYSRKQKHLFFKCKQLLDSYSLYDVLFLYNMEERITEANMYTIWKYNMEENTRSDDTIHKVFPTFSPSICQQSFVSWMLSLLFVKSLIIALYWTKTFSGCVGLEKDSGDTKRPYPFFTQCPNL